MAEETTDKTADSASAKPVRHFWHTMIYRCNGCPRQLTMSLEDGCEGPPGGREVRVSTPVDKPGEASGVLRFTPAGRAIQPVPFGIACTCKRQVQGRFGTSTAYMSHVNWKADADIDVTWRDDSVPDFPHFAYDTSESPQACGIPVNHR